MLHNKLMQPPAKRLTSFQRSSAAADLNSYMATVKFLVIAICISLTACVTSDVKERTSFEKILTGKWGWTKHENRACFDEFAHRIEFSEGGNRMYVHHPPGAYHEGKPRPFAEYKILAIKKDVLTGQIVDESRLTDDGNLVVWDLVLIARDTYCWHRTDWRSGACTNLIRKCQ